jgi:hypothetical protein
VNKEKKRREEKKRKKEGARKCSQTQIFCSFKNKIKSQLYF